ncbi:hypothetical protein [Corynebacterium glaucum]|uniref:hypothetical protein n=1 Tax=Corynebacterium glaucum TaxID=187491 RepID=UPI0025B52A30|nr:hypothetical protein [Corynebacterium glaucum]
MKLPRRPQFANCADNSEIGARHGDHLTTICQEYYFGVANFATSSVISFLALRV